MNSSIPLGKLLRLREYLDDDHGQATVCLSFDRDASGTCCLTGQVTAQVSMKCQRCLETTLVELVSGLAIKLAGSDSEAKQIADSATHTLDKLEIVVCEDGELDLLSVIEDELIMSLPIVARHDTGKCSATLNAIQEKPEAGDKTAQGNIKGLDVLEKLKQELTKKQDSSND